MARKLPFLCLLLFLPTLSRAQEQRCLQSATSCDSCIGAGPECAWCNAPNAKVRCDTLTGLQNASCEESHVYNPQASVSFLRNELRFKSRKNQGRDPALSRDFSMQPQEVSIHLRPGQSQSFTLSIKMLTNQPVTYLGLETSRVPSGLKVSLNSTTPGNPMMVQVTVDASQCPSRKENMTGPWTIRISNRHSPQRVKLTVHLLCHCDCSLNRTENSPTCNNKGALVCGHCQCNHGYEGEDCQTESDPFFLRDESYCRPGPGAPLCSDRGTCIEGSCECNRRINRNERYSGQFCECRNFGCEYSNGRMCAGNGRCICGKCICDEGWVGKGCECTASAASCVAKNGQICNGRGICECGSCKCVDIRYTGPTCEICPTCPGICTIYSLCVECRAFKMGEAMDRCETDCNDFSMSMVDNLDDLFMIEDNVHYCKMRTQQDCHYYFTRKLTPNGSHVSVLRNQQCPPPYTLSSMVRDIFYYLLDKINIDLFL